MNEKIKKAAAIKYNEGDAAPTITAIGKGSIAEKIIETAKLNNVPLVFDNNVIETLMELGLGSQIPEELYSVVAEILVFVDKIDRLKGNKNAK